MSFVSVLVICSVWCFHAVNLVVHNYLPALIKIRLQTVCLGDLFAKRYSPEVEFSRVSTMLSWFLMWSLFNLMWHYTLPLGSDHSVFPWGCFWWLTGQSGKEGREGVLLCWQKSGTSLRSQIFEDRLCVLLLHLLPHQVLCKEELYPTVVCLLVCRSWNILRETKRNWRSDSPWGLEFEYLGEPLFTELGQIE